MRTVCFGLLLATVMIPAQVTMIPQFLIMQKLGWYNTLQPLWIASFFAPAFYVFLLRQFLKGGCRVTWRTRPGSMAAASLLMMLPVIVIFLFAQRYFLRGVTLTGMKG
ncbi:MAG TPA: hypothetical protein VH207_03930 [Chthoniobacterales bacterium]|nr:hypothetical protein [Chthoniobacterales bacterium]